MNNSTMFPSTADELNMQSSVEESVKHYRPETLPDKGENSLE